MTSRKFVSSVHTATNRDYLARVNEVDKAQAAERAVKFDYEYWDGSRLNGYGGYKYDGRWRDVAASLVASYALAPGMSVLDVGCGKGFLLYDLARAVPGLIIAGLDISTYALGEAPPEVKPYLKVGNAANLPYKSNSFDLVLSINTLHNLYNYQLFSALREIERVSRQHKYVCVEAYRNEREKVNLMYWQLTCRVFHTPHEWEFEFDRSGYTGDTEFIFFD